jgi:ankyrin repeat protein
VNLLAGVEVTPPLCKAASRDVVEALLSAGASPTLSASSAIALTSPAALRDAAVVDMLVAAGADVRASLRGNVMPLHLAETREVVQTLLAKGADPKAITSQGRDVLCSPAATGDAEACRLLLGRVLQSPL